MAEIRKKAEVQIDEAQLAKFTLPPSGSGPSAAAPDRPALAQVRVRPRRLPDARALERPCKNLKQNSMLPVR